MIAPSQRLFARAFRPSVPALAEVPIADVHKLGSDALIARGYDKNETAVLMDVMLWSQLREGSAPPSGLSALTSGALAPPVQSALRPLEYETKLSARIDGQQRTGMLVMHQATEVAVQKARQNGVGLVGTRNVGSSTGALGYYLESIAKNGLIGLLFAQTPAAAAGGAATAGASPLGVSVPSARGPVVLDAASAAVSVLGGDTSAGLSGALSVFDRSYKGSHLSVMVELLAGPLVGAGSSADHYGNLVLAFDPELLGDKEAFLRDVEAVMLRKASAAPSTMLPGEAATRTADAALRHGNVNVDDALLAALNQVVAAPPGASNAASSLSEYERLRATYGMATRLAHPAGKGKGDPFNASSPVLYQTATFELDPQTLSGDYDYSRSGNPTRHMIEEQVCHISPHLPTFPQIYPQVSQCLLVSPRTSPLHLLPWPSLTVLISLSLCRRQTHRWLSSRELIRPLPSRVAWPLSPCASALSLPAATSSRATTSTAAPPGCSRAAPRRRAWRCPTST